MEACWSDLPTFRDCGIAAVGIAPRATNWTIPVRNARFEIKVHLRDSGWRRFVRSIGFGSVADNLSTWFSKHFCRKSVQRFRVELLDFARSKTQLVAPREKYVIDGQHRWVAVRTHAALSYRHSRRLFKTVADVLASSRKVSSDLWHEVITAAIRSSTVVESSPWQGSTAFDLCKDRTHNFSIHTGISPPAVALVRSYQAIIAGGKSVPVFRRKIECNFSDGTLRRHPRRSGAARLSFAPYFCPHSSVFRHWRVRSRSQVGAEQIRSRRRSMDTDIQLGLGSQLRCGASASGRLIGGAL